MCVYVWSILSLLLCALLLGMYQGVKRQRGGRDEEKKQKEGERRGEEISGKGNEGRMGEEGRDEEREVGRCEGRMKTGGEVENDGEKREEGG